MKLAAIDIGSNSIHLIIAHIHRDGTWTVVDRGKDMVGLASHTLANGYLSEQALARGLECLHTFKRMADAQGTDAIVAVATSAVREAANAEHFITLARTECDIDVRVISGKEEARLIYLGARNHIDWADRKALIVDIGGGSVEFIVGSRDHAEMFASLKLGVRRLGEEFLQSDPPTRTQLKALSAHVETALGKFTRKLADRHPFDFVVGTSGTLSNLALMGALKEGTHPVGSHGQWANLATLKLMARELSGMTLEQRKGYPGLDPKRRDTIVPGAQLTKYILRAVGRDSYVCCDYALRDGLVVDYIETHGPGRRTSDDLPDLRRRSVLALYRKFNQSGAHPRQVSQLALSLFDQLQPIHLLAERGRETLEHAALLHDIGLAISQRSHHNHSHYLIIHGELHGFSREEIHRIALVARYHRQQPPRKKHRAMAELVAPDRRRVRILAAILRLANALDRSHANNVSGLQCRLTNDTVHIDIFTHSDPALELWAAEDNCATLERALRRKIVVVALPAQQLTMPWAL